MVLSDALKHGTTICHDDQNNALPVNEEVQVIYSLASQLRFNNSSRTHYNPATLATPNTILCLCFIQFRFALW